MSHSSIARAAADPDLQKRIEAAINREVGFNDALANTEFGQAVLRGVGHYIPIYWQVAVDTEAAYEAALVAGRGAPGHDVDVITDAALTAAVVAAWPPDAGGPI